VRAALPAHRRTLSAADVAAIHVEHAATISPMAVRLAEAARLERAFSSLINRAYGLTPEEERLMWATALPRMPISPPGEDAWRRHHIASHVGATPLQGLVSFGW
jgi:hypothetical protein